MIFDEDKFETFLNDYVPKLLAFYNIPIKSSRWWWNYVGGNPDINAISVHLSIDDGSKLYNATFNLYCFNYFWQLKDSVSEYFYKLIRNQIAKFGS